MSCFGFGGGSGNNGSQLVATFEAGENLGGQRIVMLSAGKAVYFDPTNDSSIGRELGITNNAALIGDKVVVVQSGIITSNGWGLTQDAIYYADINGQITTVLPSGAFVFQRVGVAIDSNSLKLEFSEPVSII